jgi:FtsZ-binding cell division protein ZapB
MPYYTPTALKKFKKDELVEMILTIQAQKVNDSMDEVVCEGYAKLWQERHELGEQIEVLKAENEKLKENLKLSEDKVCELSHEIYEHYIQEEIEKFKALVEVEKLKEENERLDKQRVLDIQRMMKGDEYKKENEALKKQKIPDDIISAFTGLKDNWWFDEEQFYSETFEPEQEPEDIPTDKLEPCNYRDLRVLDEWFQKINQK